MTAPDSGALAADACDGYGSGYKTTAGVRLPIRSGARTPFSVIRVTTSHRATSALCSSSHPPLHHLLPPMVVGAPHPPRRTMVAPAPTAFVVAAPAGAPSTWAGSPIKGAPSAAETARARSSSHGGRVGPIVAASTPFSDGLKLPETSRRFLIKRPPPKLPPPEGSQDAADRAARVAKQKEVYKLVPSPGLAGFPLVPNIPVAGLSWYKWLFKAGVMGAKVGRNAKMGAEALAQSSAVRGGRRPAGAVSSALGSVRATTEAAGTAASAVLAAVSGTPEAGLSAVKKLASPVTASVEKSAGYLYTMAQDEMKGLGQAVTTAVTMGEAAAAAAVKTGASRKSGDAGIPGGDAAYADYRAMFALLPLPAAAKLVDSDDMFARLRVAGPNPMSLRAVTAADLDPTAPSLPFTDAHLQALSGYEADSLAGASADGRLFVLDCRPSARVLAEGEVQYPSDPKMMGGEDGYGKQCQFGPVALFVLSASASAADPGRLEAVAIATGGPQVAEAPIHLTTPADGAAWAAAKLILNAADGAEHELKWHLGLTHMMINTIAAATHRELEEGSHPIWRLLTPHYDGLFFLNSMVPDTLLAPGGVVDLLVPVSTGAAAEYVKSVLVETHFNSLFPHVQMGARGVLDPRLAHPYREDALAHWAVLHKFVAEYVACYYPTDAAVVADYELQAWASAITAAGQQGFGERAADGSTATPGVISTAAYLADAVTLIIFTGSVQHAAVNFPQADLMTYMPFYPLGVRAPPDNEWLDDNQQGGSIREWLPPPVVAGQQLSMGAFLGGIIHQPLGTKPTAILQWGGWYQNRKVTAALNRMNQDLIKLEKHIAAREARNEVKYEYLRPTRVPRSINI